MRRGGYSTAVVGRSPPPTSEAVTRVMRSNKSTGTSPELALGRLLRKKPARSRLPGRPDFVYSRARLAVFVHGCWWHRCPVEDYPLPKTHTDFWRRKFERNVERDRLNAGALKAMGWNVIVVWEHEVKRDPKGTERRVKGLAVELLSEREATRGN